MAELADWGSDSARPLASELSRDDKVTERLDRSLEIRFILNSFLDLYVKTSNYVVCTYWVGACSFFDAFVISFNLAISIAEESHDNNCDNKALESGAHKLLCLSFSFSA